MSCPVTDSRLLALVVETPPIEVGRRSPARAVLRGWWLARLAQRTIAAKVLLQPNAHHDARKQAPQP